MARIVDGLAIANTIEARVKHVIERHKEAQPRLAVVLVGGRFDSRIYVRKKQQACERLGVGFELHTFPTDVSEGELLAKIIALNERSDVHGILIQLPLPNHLDVRRVVNVIKPEKDVDGFTPRNLGAIALGEELLAGCTAKAVIRILEHEKVELAGSDVAIVGHTILLGRPLCFMLLNRNATVTVCHKATKDLRAKLKDADVVISAAGKAGLVTADMVKEGAVVIDVGINRVGGKLCGDVAFEQVSKKAALITPVPGGVGPVTVACLMENVVNAFELQRGKHED
jgi:methylenetetrahydrofolate dehydrogenase (NADP+)/methenyltetrahydrofolate cyclohydrolase